LNEKDYKKFASLANESPAMALDMLGMTQAVEKYISDDLVAQMMMEDDETLRAYLRSGRGKRFVEAIQSALPQAKAHAYVAQGQLTQEGVTLVEGVLFFKLIPDYNLINQMPASLYDTIETIIPELYKIKAGVAANDIPQSADLTAALPQAIRFYVDNLIDSPLEWATKQTTLLKIGAKYDPSSLWGAFVALLDKLVGHPKKIRQAVGGYIERVSTGGLFEAEDPIKVLNEITNAQPPRKLSGGGFLGVEHLRNWWGAIKRGQSGQ